MDTQRATHEEKIVWHDNDDGDHYRSFWTVHDGIEAVISERMGKPGWLVVIRPTASRCEYPELDDAQICDTELAAKAYAVNGLIIAAAQYPRMPADGW